MKLQAFHLPRSSVIYSYPLGHPCHKWMEILTSLWAMYVICSGRFLWKASEYTRPIISLHKVCLTIKRPNANDLKWLWNYILEKALIYFPIVTSSREGSLSEILLSRVFSPKESWIYFLAFSEAISASNERIITYVSQSLALCVSGPCYEMQFVWLW